jgi:hypothetical protein
MALLGAITWTSIVHADDSAGIGTPEGSYSGGGYRVIVLGRDYIGFDRQGKKLVLSEPIYRTGRNTVDYKSKGYTYRLTPLGQHRSNDSSDGGHRGIVKLSDPFAGATCLQNRT